jgi:hypothetical protein
MYKIKGVPGLPGTPFCFFDKHESDHYKNLVAFNNGCAAFNCSSGTVNKWMD